MTTPTDGDEPRSAFGFEEFCALYLEEQTRLYIEDWSPDYYACAERYITRSEPVDLRRMIEDVDELLALPTERDRRTAFRHPLLDIPEEEGVWDAFLTAFRDRVLREQAGDRSRPLAHPDPMVGMEASPQGYDVTLASEGSFPSEQVAQAVVEGVLKAYDERLRAFFADSRPGQTRRLPPLRMRFDRQVGLVAVRDRPADPTRVAVVLLHDVGGEALVFHAFPMEEVPEPPELEALSVLCGGWLHADWVDDYPEGEADPVEQVRRFATTEPVETVEQAAYELHALRATGTEEDRRRAIRGLCSYFLPRPVGQLDAFLGEAAEVLDEAVRSR